MKNLNDHKGAPSHTWKANFTMLEFCEQNNRLGALWGPEGAQGGPDQCMPEVFEG